MSIKIIDLVDSFLVTECLEISPHENMYIYDHDSMTVNMYSSLVENIREKLKSCLKDPETTGINIYFGANTKFLDTRYNKTTSTLILDFFQEFDTYDPVFSIVNEFIDERFNGLAMEFFNFLSVDKSLDAANIIKFTNNVSNVLEKNDDLVTQNFILSNLRKLQEDVILLKQAKLPEDKQLNNKLSTVYLALISISAVLIMTIMDIN